MFHFENQPQRISRQNLPVQRMQKPSASDWTQTDEAEVEQAFLLPGIAVQGPLIPQHLLLLLAGKPIAGMAAVRHVLYKRP